MGTTAQKLQKSLDSKEAIRQAIMAKGVAVPAETMLSAYPDKIGAIQAGGGSSQNGFLVRFIDDDGTILKDEYVQPGGSATPPANQPGDDIRTFLGWSGSYQNVTMNEIVGAKYWFGSGADLKSYLFINLNAATGLTINVRLYITSGSATIDWGDGTSSTTSGTGDKIMPHTYAASGPYRISIDGLQSGTGNELGGRGSTTYSVVDVTQALAKAYIGWPTVLGRYCFRDCRMLRHVSLSFVGSSTGVGNLQGFYQTYALKALVVPSTYKLYGTEGPLLWSGIRYFVMPSGFLSGYSITTNGFANCNALEEITLPPVQLSGSQTFQYCYGLKSAYLNDIPSSENKQLGGSIFYGCFNLESVRLPSNVADIFGLTFYNCYSIKRIDFPATVTNFGANIIDYCWSLKTVIIRSVTPPTVSGTNPLSVIARIPVDLKFYVPDASLASYKAATGWVSVADRIYPLSELPV